MELFGFGARKEHTLASLKRRAKVGATLTMLANNLSGTNTPMPHPIIGAPRRVLVASRDGLGFDPNGPGGKDNAVFVWPQERQERSLGMRLNPSGTLAGFVDDDTFVVDYAIYYSVFRLDA
ncbi:hypothetical protein J8I87_29360 [Paraburkholderia sp. LEh10]|uniref:hypothetical protein n=1 Tax=Paraburkholderia sp. LEh10 TaxID=2821353 RepID=UPI001AE4656F|nr:hypothetical protein [Paraburkholderia sp. LEh10]MBP0593724.1 hypothetical protein [Paraburkholderia sp. LEh10]